jgi:hypothetical protein
MQYPIIAIGHTDLDKPLYALPTTVRTHCFSETVPEAQVGIVLTVTNPWVAGSRLWEDHQELIFQTLLALAAVLLVRVPEPQLSWMN